MDSLLNTLKNVEFKGDKTDADLTKKFLELTAANQQLAARCETLETKLNELTSRENSNQNGTEFQQVRKKVDELSIGFEYIRLYGF